MTTSRMLVVMNDEDGSFNELERFHRASIQSYVLKRTGNLYLSEEIVQETFVRAWSSRETLRRHENPKAWLLTVAKNLIADHYRDSSRSARRASEIGLLTLPQGGDSAFGYESSEHLEEILKLLSEDHRNVLMYCVIEGYSTQEASEILKIPSGTVKSRLFYALKDLRVKLSEREKSIESE